MKNLTKRLLSLATVMAMILAIIIPVGADSSSKEGSGNYNVTISNDVSSTGVSIEGDTFHAYQIFIADDVTSYSVTEGFRGFFFGTLTDDNGTEYKFGDYLPTINSYETSYGTSTVVGTDGSDPSATDVANYEAALSSYDHLAGSYMDSYENNMYALAIQIRTYLDRVGTYNDGDVTCMAHATATANAAGDYESATIVGLDTGYYFILDQESTANGLGVSASGAFMPITTDSSTSLSIEVKESIPTMVKNIYHDDVGENGEWDIVGDSQIGDTVSFRVISTMPANIDDYILKDVNDEGYNSAAINKYDYILTDTMSAGLTYNSDIKIYTDAAKQNEVSDTYYTITTPEEADSFAFKVTVNVIDLLTADSTIGTLYIYYSATLNTDAVVASDYDTNTAELEYSNNPYEDTTDSTDSTVTHFTIALDVNKVDESGNALAGARFGLFDEDGFAIPLGYVDTNDDGVDLYCYDTSVDVVSDGGYITTNATGQFSIYGLNDQTTYTLREVEAPEGYSTADSFNIFFTVKYNDLGTVITDFTDGSPYVYTIADNGGDWSSTSTIINRLKIYLPSTGGVGTVLFQVGGGVLMLGAIVVLVSGQRKKSKDTPE